MAPELAEYTIRKCLLLSVALRRNIYYNALNDDVILRITAQDLQEVLGFIESYANSLVDKTEVFTKQSDQPKGDENV